MDPCPLQKHQDLAGYAPPRMLKLLMLNNIKKHGELYMGNFFIVWVYGPPFPFLIKFFKGLRFKA